MSNVIKLSDIEAKPVIRCLMGFDELDWIYGKSIHLNGSVVWGMPKGKISLWSGMSGTGKSRLGIEVVKNWVKLYPEGKVLYIMTESPLSDFASWAKDTSQYNNVYCSSVDQIDEIIKVIYEVKPHLTFIDSVNEIEDFTGNAKSARRLIKGIDNKPGLKKAVDDTGGHLILLGQLNGDGSIKGGTSLPHLVDVALDIIPANTESGDDFIVKVGIKNRLGNKKGNTIFTHTDYGVINSCNNRIQDSFWCQSHGIVAPASLIVKKEYTDVITNPDGTQSFSPELQAAVEKLRNSPRGQAILRRGKPSTYSKIGDFFHNLING